MRATEILAKLTVNVVHTLVLTGLLASHYSYTLFFILYYLLVWAAPALCFLSGLKKRKKQLLLPWIVVSFIHLPLPGVACIISSLQGTKLIIWKKLHFYESELEACSASFLSLTSILAIINGTLTSLVYRKMEKPQRTSDPDILGELQTLRETTTEMNPQLRVEISGDGESPRTTTVVRPSDRENGELLPPSYSQIVSEHFNKDFNEDPPSYKEVTS